MPQLPPSPVIIVPGITATWLRDYYTLPPQNVWGVLGLTHEYERVRLHPNNIRFEATQPADIRPDQVFEVAYEELINELRYNLSESPEKPVPVFPFGYDWREPLQRTEEKLEAFISDVIERTKLLPHYAGAGYGEAPKVNLIGHSMGGLVIAGYVERYGAGKVDRAATLATPYRGSFEAMVKLATGTANLGGSTPSSREREAARVTPSIYHLLPDYETGVIAERGAGLPKSTFDRRLYQPSIIRSVVTYAERFALDSRKEDRAKRGRALFRDFLDGAKAHRDRVGGLDLAAKGLGADRWLCVVGVDAKTRVRMTVALDERGKPEFRLTSDDMLNQWAEAGGDREMTGDGTVHLRGAIPGFLPRESLVCVTPDDFGYWELQDKALTRLSGFHGILPNMDMIHRLLARFLTGAPDPRGNTWGRPAPGVSPADWKPPLDGLKLKG